MSDQLKNPVVGDVFELELDGINLAAFEEVDVPEQVRALIQNRDGTDANHSTVTLGKFDPITITLRKAVRQLDNAVVNSFIEWRDKGGQMKKSGTVTYKHSETGVPYFRISFENAVCQSFKSPALNSNANDIAKYEIKIVVPRVYEVAL